MNIRSQEIDSKKKIGTLRGRPVFEIATKGGYHLVCSVQPGGIEYHGSGPHRAVARFIAKKRSPDMLITELSKSDHVEPEHFARLVPQYETMTDQLNVASKK